jgi:hypothetical protein
LILSFAGNDCPNRIQIVGPELRLANQNKNPTARQITTAYTPTLRQINFPQKEKAQAGARAFLFSL